jgi:leucyl-tRNA synthetase
MSTPWNDSGVKGARRFLDKIWRMFPNVTDEVGYSKDLERVIHETIMGVSDDLENLKFNTAIAKLMSLVNEYNKQEKITRSDYEVLLTMLNPIAPHITEELWSMLGHETLLVFETYPEYDESKLVKDEIDLIISVNGKLRDKMVVENNLAEEKLKKIALGREKIQAFIDGKEIVKIIVVPNKLVNIVIK